MGWSVFVFLREKVTSWACLVISGLNITFHLKAHSDIFLRSSFSKFKDSDKSHAVKNNKASPAINLADDSKFSGRSLMYIKKTSGPNIDPWRMPAITGAHLEFGH